MTKQLFENNSPVSYCYHLAGRRYGSKLGAADSQGEVSTFTKSEQNFVPCRLSKDINIEMSQMRILNKRNYQDSRIAFPNFS